MQAVILAGGRERGFAGMDPSVPRALLPLGNTPLLVHLLAYLGRQGINQATVCLNADARIVEKRIPDGTPWGITLRYRYESAPTGTAGSLRGLRSAGFDGPLLLVTGVPFLDFPLTRLLTLHRERRAAASLGLTRWWGPAGYPEEIVEGPDGQVEAVRVPYGQPGGRGLRTLGVYLLEPAALERIGQESYLDLKEQLLPRLRRAGESVLGLEVPGLGVRLDGLPDYLAFSQDFLSNGYMGWIRRDSRESRVRLGPAVSVAPSAALLGPLCLGERSTVSAHVRVEGPTAIGAGCSLATRSAVVASVLLEGVEVAERAQLERCLVGPGCRIPPGASLRDAVLTQPRGNGAGPLIRPLAESGLIHGEVRAAATGDHQKVKRGLDLCLAAAGLLFSAPLLGLAALAIRLDSPGPVFFRQRRVGEGGREFSMLKLRSMVRDAECQRERLIDQNEIDGPMFKMGNDPRITRVGAFLRRTRIDELPQLWNVLKGEMSLVGPRPLAMAEMDCNPAWREIRLTVRPGATGLWQVESMRRNSFQDWIQADIRYVQERSLALDLRILARTAREVVRSLLGR